jgi:hypothetical protein
MLTIVTDNFQVWVVNGFIVAYLFLAWNWNLPDDSPCHRMIKRASRTIRWLGLWHSWSMFSPRPDMHNRRIRLKLLRENDDTAILDTIDLSKMSRFQAFQQVRERKYDSNIASSDFKSHREALCIHAANQFSTASSRVVQVELILIKQAVPKAFLTEMPPPTEQVLWTWKPGKKA